ncbi:protein patched homolog 1 isoform X2 [Aplysia californica]|uniref:Protein patched homolog 1 isoform X2 n=1 Tax=Aplysia californica TaxID=6500 RepID=A0ABM0JQ62_APLCA|nr:protein patched homolog 1 isoform X2 [Aplysia californica]
MSGTSDLKHSANGVHSNGHAPNGDVNGGTSERKVSCLQRFSNVITGGLEKGFERIGLSIGTHPWRYILGCVIVAALTGLGLLAFNEVSDPDKLWVPNDAQVLRDKDWISANYPSTVVREQIIAVGQGNNILTPSGISALLDIYQNSTTISTSNGITLSDVCLKAGANCLVYSVLEIWSYNDATIRSLTQDEIVDAVNNVNTSALYGSSFDITTYLGSRTTNSSGHITAAAAASMVWLTEGNETMESTTEAWEAKFLELGQAGHADLASTYVFARRSFSDESGDAIQGDVMLLSIGYFIVIIFVFLVLGKFNQLEQRIWLSLGGFICVGFSMLVSIGLSSAFQQDYGPLQSVLPFLLLGIGVDDMFVIMGALNNLRPDEQGYDIPHKMADVLRHAGVSITVTSLTDFVAFMIGATTIIPALRSFCIYAGVGIIALYVFQALFFSACLTLDLRRMEAGRNACCCCVKHDLPYEPNKCSQKQFLPYVFKQGLAKLITKLPFKIFVVTVAAAMFGVNVWGLVELEQYFNPNWFLPQDSYAYAFTEASEQHFPDDGASGFVYCGNLNYWSRQTEVETMDSAMANSKWIYTGTTDSWFSALTTWLASTSDATVTPLLDANKYPVSEDAFINLTYKMTTQIQQRTSSYLKFSSSTGSDILVSRFPFRHIDMDDASTEIDAMDSTRELVMAAGFSNAECFPYSRRYLTWETNKVIREELYRNLALALACVFLVTLILIANLWTSLMVFAGVLFTLVDVAGSMHFWGLTVDTVTSIILILSIGLAVDYSAHIGHMFMTVVGTRTARTKETVGEMGPPVFYGGFSTFLAFVLLSNSNSYVFQTFFKVNFLVVVYGLFHGLIFLPVILSWFGPEPYPTADRVYRHHHEHHPDVEKVDGVDNRGFSKNGEGSKVGGYELPPLRNAPTGANTAQEVTDLNVQNGDAVPVSGSPAQQQA